MFSIIGEINVMKQLILLVFQSRLGPLTAWMGSLLESLVWIGTIDSNLGEKPTSNSSLMQMVELAVSCLVMYIHNPKKVSS